MECASNPVGEIYADATKNNINPLVIKTNEQSASLSNQDFQKKVQNAIKIEGNKVKCANPHISKVPRKNALIRIRYN